eukprot:TRINITY_DN5317_c0_g1_i1.p1 TRINITY_DN5317_c0_g1~~TRINITY_DN5317_c0_g1_i1.p1  ORF type:complete len:309 (+),score=90.66 TRINITY_DN5317_c0_g1_i1:117-929(+)
MESSAVGIFKEAIAAGYRMFDCAEFYGNEHFLGQALKESGIPREEFFIISKIWTDKIYEGEAAIRKQLDVQLQSLGTDYLDLYLIHWPVPVKHVAAYQTLEKLCDEKKILAAGLSNYTIEDYEELRPHIRIPPLVNQIEVNPFLYRKKTIDFFINEGVDIQAYRALRQGTGLETELLSEIAKKYTKTPAQILGRWCIQKNFMFLPKTSQKDRMKENLDIFDFELAEEDMKQLETLTTEENKKAMEALYRKGLVRNTPLKEEDVRHNITTD